MYSGAGEVCSTEMTYPDLLFRKMSLEVGDGEIILQGKGTKSEGETTSQNAVADLAFFLDHSLYKKSHQLSPMGINKAATLVLMHGSLQGAPASHEASWPLSTLSSQQVSD